MPTVIDSLVVELGLDPKKFTAGQKAALEAFKKTREDAAKGAKDAEATAARLNETIAGTTRRFLGLMSLFIGGVGIKDFVIQQTKMNFETGRTAQIFDTTTKALSAWRTVATLTGGTAQGITGAIGGLVTNFQNFALTGESSVIPYFRALQVDMADASGRMRNMDDILLDLADRFSKLDPARARAFGQALGFDEATISLLIRGRDAVKGLLDNAKSLGTVSKEDADAAEKLTKAWNEAETAATRLGNTLLTKLSPSLSKILQGFTRLFQGHAGNPGSILDRLVNGSSNLGGAGSSAEPSEVWGGAAVAPGLRTKTGAGSTSLATAALAQSLQSQIPGIDRFTAFDDVYHQLLGRGSAHKRGQALDFTLKDASQAQQVASQIRSKLAAMGIDGTVLDEYNHPSKGSTGGHIHVQFNSADAASRYAELTSNAGRTAGAGAVDRSSTSSNATTVGSVNIYPPNGDPDTIAKSIKPAIERNMGASNSQAGPQ